MKYEKIKQQQLYKQLLTLAANHGLPKAINLAIYDNDAALKLFRPNETWAGGCNEHTALMGALKAYVEQDFDSFEARLSNGVKVEFHRDGNWKEIESYNGVNPTLLPAQVAATLQSTFPNVTIIKVEKEWNGYEIKLSNMLKVYINEAGQVIGQKYDD